MNRLAVIATLAFFCGMYEVNAQAVCPPGEISEVCSDTDTLQIGGTIEVICDIEVIPGPAAMTLDIINGEDNTVVATVNEFSNAPNGYEVLVESTNDGKLVNQLSAAATPIDYQMSYGGGTPFAPTSSAQTVFSTSNDTGGSINSTKDVAVSFPAQPNAESGTYSDTLSFTMRAL